MVCVIKMSLLFLQDNLNLQEQEWYHTPNKMLLEKTKKATAVV